MNIIISRTDKIGDLVLSIPSFFMIKKMYPQATLTVLVRNYNYDVVKNLPYIDRVIKIDDYSEKDLLKLVEDIKAEIFIALYTDKFVGKIARASKARWRIGPFSKLHSYFSYNKGVFQKRSKSLQNEAQYNLDLVKRINPELYLENYELNTQIFYEKTHEEFAKDFLMRNKIDKFILIHPFSGGSAKNITDIQYVQLINRILGQNNDVQVVISASTADKVRANFIKDETKNERVLTFVNEGSLLNLVALIDKCDVFIGTSTGPTHLAGSLGKKIIAIYPIKKTQSVLRWGVFGNDKVEYILPEGEKEEDYSVKEFLSWDEKDLEKILLLLRS